MPSFVSSVSLRSLERMLMNPGCRAQLLQLKPELDRRFKQLDCFYHPGEHCDIFDSALKLCAIDLEDLGLGLLERGIKTKDGSTLWPK